MNKNVVLSDPQLWNGPKNMRAELDTTVTINCSICAEPMPVYFTWYKDGKGIDEVSITWMIF